MLEIFIIVRTHILEKSQHVVASFLKPSQPIIKIFSWQASASKSSLLSLFSFSIWHIDHTFCSKLWSGELSFGNMLTICTTLNYTSFPVHFRPLFAYRCQYLHSCSRFTLSKNDLYLQLHGRYLLWCTELILWDLSTLIHTFSQSKMDYFKLLWIGSEKESVCAFEFVCSGRNFGQFRDPKRMLHFITPVIYRVGQYWGFSWPY